MLGPKIVQLTQGLQQRLSSGSNGSLLRTGGCVSVSDSICSEGQILYWQLCILGLRFRNTGKLERP